MANVLLVEDDPDQLAMRRLILEGCGHPVTIAKNASEAKQRFAGQDVVVMDLRIPSVEDGLALIDSLNRLARIIVLTGDQGVQALPVDAQFLKPCSSQILVDTVVQLSCKSALK